MLKPSSGFPCYKHLDPTFLSHPPSPASLTSPHAILGALTTPQAHWFFFLFLEPFNSFPASGPWHVPREHLPLALRVAASSAF